METDPQTVRLLRAFHLNQCVWVSRLATGEIDPSPHHPRLFQANGTNAMLPGASGVLMLPLDAATETTRAGIDATLAWLREHPLNDALVWRMTPDAAIDLEMLAHGFLPGFEPVWMTRDLTTSLPLPRHDIRLATADDIDALAGTDIPYLVPNQVETTRQLTVATRSGMVRWLVAYERGNLIGQAIVNITGDHAGLFNVGVSGRHRRRGVGSSLTAAAMHHARQAGATTMNLNSTPMGLQVYERLGFRRYGVGQTWSAIGRWARTAVDQRSRDMTIAVGRGDIGQLPTNFHAIAAGIACGLTPQQLAARFGQQETIRHIISLGSIPDIISMWNAGMRDEAIAACDDARARELPTGLYDARPLHHAVEAGAGTLVLALVRAGADLTARDDEYDATPLDWAHATNKPTIARILRQAGAR